MHKHHRALGLANAPSGTAISGAAEIAKLKPVQPVTLLRPHAARRAARENEIPLRRIGMPEDMAGAIRFLLSADASYITGVNLLVDGGLGQTLMVSPSSASQG